MAADTVQTYLSANSDGSIVIVGADLSTIDATQTAQSDRHAAEAIRNGKRGLWDSHGATFYMLTIYCTYSLYPPMYMSTHRPYSRQPGGRRLRLPAGRR